MADVECAGRIVSRGHGRCEQREGWVLMTGVDAFELMRRVWRRDRPHHKPPWEDARVRLFGAGTMLCGIRYAPSGFPIQVVLWEDYHWNPDAEELPGAGVWSMLDKRAPTMVGEAGVPVTPPDEQSAKKFPTLHSHLTQGKWPDGSDRETSTLNVWYDGSIYKAMLRDRSEGMVLFVACPSLVKLLDTLEGAVADPRADWRTDKNGGSPKGKKK